MRKNKTKNCKIFYIFFTILVIFTLNDKLEANGWMKAENCESSGGKADPSKGIVDKWISHAPGMDPFDLYGTEDQIRKQYGAYGAMAYIEKVDTGYVCCTYEPTPTKPVVPETPPEPEDPCAYMYESSEDDPPTCNNNISENVGCGGTVEDPKMCNIMANKNENYKVGGNDYCEIYCREELKLTFQSKVEVIAGRYFRHDLNGKDQVPYLSAVIVGEYECASKIDYKKWKKDWITANENLITTWNEYSQWYVACDKQVSPAEEIEAECPTCDLECEISVPCNPDEPCSSKIEKVPSAVTGGPQGPTKIKHYYLTEEAPYGVSTCQPTDCTFTSATCSVSNSYASWDSGKFSNSCSCEEGYSCVMEQGQDVCTTKKEPAWIAYDSAMKKIDKLKNDINQCNHPENYAQNYFLGNIVEAGCSYGIGNYGGYEENYVYKKGYAIKIEGSSSGNLGTSNRICNESQKWSEFCGSCDQELQAGSCEVENLVEYECPETPGPGVVCKVKTYTVEKNGMVSVKSTASTQHYQSSEFYTQLFTGNISTNPTGKDWISIGKSTWPVAAERKTGIYDLCYTIKNLGGAPVRSKIPFSNIYDNTDCKYKVINELNVYDCNDGYHECYECPDGEECYTCPDGENCETGPGDYDYSFGVYFRSVNLDDLFPNSKFSKYSVPITSERKIGYNWKNSKDVVDAIQSIDNIWAPDHLDYSVTLTPTAIRNIKQYNKDAENYLDNSLSCDNSLFCSSKFLSSKLEDLGVTNIFRNNDTFTESRYIKPVGGNS